MECQLAAHVDDIDPGSRLALQCVRADSARAVEAGAQLVGERGNRDSVNGVGLVCGQRPDLLVGQVFAERGASAAAVAPGETVLRVVAALDAHERVGAEGVASGIDPDAAAGTAPLVDRVALGGDRAVEDDLAGIHADRSAAGALGRGIVTHRCIRRAGVVRRVLVAVLAVRCVVRCGVVADCAGAAIGHGVVVVAEADTGWAAGDLGAVAEEVAVAAVGRAERSALVNVELRQPVVERGAGIAAGLSVGPDGSVQRDVPGVDTYRATAFHIAAAVAAGDAREIGCQLIAEGGEPISALAAVAAADIG